MDWTLVYIMACIMILPAFIYGGISHIMAENTFQKYAESLNQKGIPAHELTKKLLETAGITNVEVVRINGFLTDCYDPRNKVIKLSDSTYNSTSIAAAGVCAHEVGHAIQDAKGAFLFRLRSSLVPVVNFISKLYIPLILVGAILGMATTLVSFGYVLTWAAVIMYGANTLFYFVTLPLEHDASKNALLLLQDTGDFTGTEIDSAKRVLKAAIQTYIGTLIVSALYFLRFLSYAMIFRKND